MSDSNDATLLGQLDEEVRRFERKRSGTLRFSANMEKRYWRETAIPRARVLLVQGSIALLAYDFLIVGDYFIAPTHLARAAAMRFGVFTPIAFLVCLLLRWRKAVFLQDSAAAFLCLLASLSILYLQHGMGASFSLITQSSLLLVLLVANCMFRLDLPFAIGTTAAIVALNLLSLKMDAQLTFAQRSVAGGILFWVAILTLTVNYTLTRERRYSYLLHLRGGLQRSLLAGANAELLALSATDRLTGLPNRHAYDERLAALWQLCLERSEPISAVMVDVDHFKQLNDSYGHPFGDRVLQRVSSLLQQALREEDDFVARFGGEEFVILLPNANLESARIVAERVRTLVQVAGSPAVQRDTPVSPQNVWTTVSCGVATAWPATSSEAGRLITEADAALYRAKREGRNRVCCALEIPSSAKVVPIFPGAARA